jgi:glyoxylase-like metal-dependent hydrolase (beta-lactamase superfamily II)
MRSLVIRCDDRTVLVDCGIWNYFPDKLRDSIYAIEQPDPAKNLADNAGLAGDDITDIIATHLHFDHVGGFAVRTNAGYATRFPNARLHVQRSQLEWACNPSAKDRGSYVAPLVELIRAHPHLVVHEGPWSLVPGIETDVANGHTPGMQIVRTKYADNWLIHTADMVPTSSHIPIPYIMAYDNEPLVTAREKEHLFSTWPEAIYFFEHDPGQPFWTITRTDRGGWIRKDPVTL